MRRYPVLLADPPWAYRDQHRGRGGAADHYEVMSLEDIKAMAIPAADDCVLFLWSTCPQLPAALEVIDSWGFRFVTTAFTWVKLNPSGRGLATGLGYWTRSNCEPCLLAVRGRPRPATHRVHSVVIAPRGRHSEKPEEVRRRIEHLTGPGPRLELFARRRVPGWDAFGKEVQGSITIERRLVGPLTHVPLRPQGSRQGVERGRRRWSNA